MTEYLDRLRRAFADRYTIEAEVGRGGMATVYRADDFRRHRKVAVKVLRPELAEGIAAERFLREIEIAAGLSHPNILPLYDSGKVNGYLYYVMPFVDGDTLRDLLDREKQLSVEDTVRITGEIAEALDFAHKQGVVHRDIKPENILLHTGRAVVSDFGIALAVSAAGGDRLTETGMAMGTPAYMSPEQSSGETRLDGRSDVYSLGCVAYEMLVGEPPYTGVTPQSIIARRLSQPPPSIRVVRENLSAGHEYVVHKALSKVPADRYTTAEGFAAALATPPLIKETRHVDRKSAILVVAAAVLLLLAAGFLPRLMGGGELSTASLDESLVAVMPFRVSAATAMEDHRFGIAERMSWVLSTDSARPVVAVDQAEVRRLWRRAVADDNDELSEEQARELAIRLDAGLLVTGSVVGSAQQLTITAWLNRVGHDRPRIQHSVPGPSDSLDRMISRLTAELFFKATGVSLRSDSLLRVTPVPAIWALVEGRRAVAQGDAVLAADRLTVALDLDSTLAPAAVELLDVVRSDDESIAGDGMSDVETRAQRLAWAFREKLSSNDSAYMVSRLGPAYPSQSTVRETFAAVDVAVGTARDNAKLLLRWNDLLFRWGDYLRQPDWHKSAGNALARVIANTDSTDASYASLLGRQLLLEVRKGAAADTMRIRRLVESILTVRPDWHLVQWRASHALADSAMLQRVRERSDEWRPEMLADLMLYTVLDDLPWDDVERLIDTMDERAMTAADRLWVMNARHTLASVQGRTTEAATLLDSIVRLDPDRDAWTRLTMPVVHALISPGYAEAAERAAETLTRAAAADDQVDPFVRHCYVEAWRISHGDMSTTRESIARLWSRVGDNGLLGVCPLLLEAMVEQRNAAGPTVALERLDSLMNDGVVAPLSNVANLLLARWWRERGDYGRALTAVRRVPYDNSILSLYPAHLREVGRLAALDNDTSGAKESFRHYLNLRSNCDSLMQPQVDSVITELRVLGGER